MLTVVLIAVALIALIGMVALLLTTRSGGRRGALDQRGVHMHGQEMRHTRPNGFHGPNTR